MPNYSNGKIYKLECHSTGKVYIGSTTVALCKRKTGHETDFRRYQAGKYIYVSSYEVLKNRNYDIYLIEAFPCNTKEELHAREGYYIKLIDCVNKRIAGRTIKDYRTENKDKIKKKNDQYYQDNKETITKKIKKYYQDKKDKIKETKKKYYHNNKDKIKQKNDHYYQDNKDKLKIYYQDNKDKVIKYYQDNKDKFTEKHNCQCGGKYTTINKARHEKTNKHLDWLKTQIN